jgi:hypothetical protein
LFHGVSVFRGIPLWESRLLIQGLAQEKLLVAIQEHTRRRSGILKVEWNKQMVASWWFDSDSMGINGGLMGINGGLVGINGGC